MRDIHIFSSSIQKRVVLSKIRENKGLQSKIKQHKVKESMVIQLSEFLASIRINSGLCISTVMLSLFPKFFIIAVTQGSSRVYPIYFPHKYFAGIDKYRI